MESLIGWVVGVAGGLVGEEDDGHGPRRSFSLILGRTGSSMLSRRRLRFRQADVCIGDTPHFSNGSGRPVTFDRYQTVLPFLYADLEVPRVN